MPEFLFQPSPHTAASEFLRAKPAISRAVFDGLLPELRGRTFLITGIEDLNIVQRLRDRIADLPAGAAWDEIKGEVAEGVSAWIDEDQAPGRAELLLRTHGYQAYSAAQKEVVDRQRDIFPYLMYQTAQDDHVRDSHSALDGKILPADSPFWQTHYPPWDFGCRCTVVPLMQEDVEEIREEDTSKPAEEQRIVEGARLAQAEQGTLIAAENGVPRRVNLTPGEFATNPSNLRIPLEQLRRRYDPEIFVEFERFARQQRLEDGRTVWEWLEGDLPS